jgi:protein-tyrosine phosphatase
LKENKRILFVCLGNIVRSPLAENIFRQLTEAENLVHNYQADSAGTGAWHVGESPDSRMVRVAARHGLFYSGQARQVTRQDFEDFDVLVAMDRDNRAMLFSLARGAEQQAKIHLLREFDPLGKPHAEVPDPYYGGMDGFEDTYQIVYRSCKGLLEALENNHLG